MPAKALSNWPIYILTLHGDNSRRAPLEHALQNMGLEYELFFGIDGRRGLSKDLAQYIDRNLTVQTIGRDLTNTEYACALSHRAIYEKIIDTDLDGAIILEDDARILPGLERFVRNADYLLAPMILLDYAFGRATRLRRMRASCGQLRRVATQCTVTTGYSINLDVAYKLLQVTTPVKATADWPVSLYDLQAWMLVPRPVRHDPPGVGFSHLDADRRKRKDGALRITGPRAWLRRKLSVRVGRARGER